MTKKARQSRSAALTLPLSGSLVRGQAGTGIASVSLRDLRRRPLNVKLVRLFITLFLISLPAWAEQGPRLVEVFCSHPAGETSAEWTSLVGRLESRTADLPETLVQSPEFQACVSQNESFFSTAEFAWKGRQVIREAVQQASPEVSGAGVRVALSELDFELPLVGTVSVGSRQSTLTEAVDPYGYAERAKLYDQLWEDFLATLKNREESRAGDRQVAKNTR